MSEDDSVFSVILGPARSQMGNLDLSWDAPRGANQNVSFGDTKGEVAIRERVHEAANSGFKAGHGSPPRGLSARLSKRLR